jgi:hypothetical protein
MRHQTIEFRIFNAEDETEVIPFIDNESLIDMLQKVEIQYDAKITGRYKGLTINDFVLESERKQAKKVILDCQCRNIGCWSFEVTITETENTILWEDFEQVHRKHWDYTALGTFQFDKKDYLEKIEKIKILYVR